MSLFVNFWAFQSHNFERCKTCAWFALIQGNQMRKNPGFVALSIKTSFVIVFSRLTEVSEDCVSFRFCFYSIRLAFQWSNTCALLNSHCHSGKDQGQSIFDSNKMLWIFWSLSRESWVQDINKPYFYLVPTWSQVFSRQFDFNLPRYIVDTSCCVHRSLWKRTKQNGARSNSLSAKFNFT